MSTSTSSRPPDQLGAPRSIRPPSTRRVPGPSTASGRASASASAPASSLSRRSSVATTRLGRPTPTSTATVPRLRAPVSAAVENRQVSLLRRSESQSRPASSVSSLSSSSSSARTTLPTRIRPIGSAHQPSDSRARATTTTPRKPSLVQLPRKQPPQPQPQLQSQPKQQQPVRARRQPRGSTTLEELLRSGLFSSPSTASGRTPTSSSSLLGGPTSRGENRGTAQPESTRGHDDHDDDTFEFLMDAEVSRIMLDEINAVGRGNGGGASVPGGGGGGGGTPWRGRVVSLSMSQQARRDGTGGGEDFSFELDEPPSAAKKKNNANGPERRGTGQGLSTPRAKTTATTAAAAAGRRRNSSKSLGSSVVRARRGRMDHEDDDDDDDDGRGQETSREVLVLQRVDDVQVDELRRDNEALTRQVAGLTTARELAERELAQERQRWLGEQHEFERQLAAASEEANTDPHVTTRVELARLEATTASQASQTAYETVAGCAARDKDELAGALDALRLIATGLAVWDRYTQTNVDAIG